MSDVIASNVPSEQIPSDFTPLPIVANLEDLNDTTSYVAISSGAGWGDSITVNNQSDVMLAAGSDYSDFTALNYAPAGAANTIVNGNWPDEMATLVGAFIDQGAGGETSSQILTRLQAGTPSAVDVVSFGTNDSVNTVAKQQNLVDNMKAVAVAGYDKAKTVFMPYIAGGKSSGSSAGIIAQAELEGFKTFDWNTAQLKYAHSMEGDSSDLNAKWLTGELVPAFMSAVTIGGPLDTTHPGPAFSAALSEELAALAAAIATPSTAPPYMHMQNLSVDWNVSAGTVIGQLDTEGTVSNTAINNDLGNTDLITLSGTQVLRGTGAAPSTPWVDFFIEVQNANGSFLQRLSLGRSVGRTLFKQTNPTIRDYLLNSGTSGTISIVGKQLTSAASRYMRIGDFEILIRTNGDLWFKGPFSPNNIFGGNIGDLQHWMVTWDGATCYKVLDSTYTDISSSFTGATIGGPLDLFGATSGATTLVAAEQFETGHIYISDQYYGPATDLSPIWSGTDTNITGPSDHLGTPAIYSCSGGAGNFATLNYGTGTTPQYHPHWDAANAVLV